MGACYYPYPTPAAGFGGIQRFSRGVAGAAGGTSFTAALGNAGPVANSAAETNVYRFISVNSLQVPLMAIRWTLLFRYSCTATPTITFRVRTGTSTPIAADVAASMVVLCRNGAVAEPMSVHLVTVLDTATWASSGGNGSVQGAAPNVVGTAFSPQQVSNVITESNFNKIQLTAQWSAADPANSVLGVAALMEVLYNVGIQ